MTFIDTASGSESAYMPSRQAWIGGASLGKHGSWQPSEWPRQSLPVLDEYLHSDSAVSTDLILTYLAADYRVEADAPFVLRVGDASPDLARLYAKFHCDCAAYVTACNPFGRINDGHDNEQRHAWLLQELAKRSLAHLEGICQDPQGQWPGEPSCLVLDLSLEAAKKLGRRYAQNGLVWCGPDAVPMLVLLR